MQFMKSVITQSVLVATLVLGGCMAVLLETASSRMLQNLEDSFTKNATEMTGFIANQINTGTRLKRTAMIEPQLLSLLEDPSIDAAAVRVTHVDGTEIAALQAPDVDRGRLPTLGVASFNTEVEIENLGDVATVRTPVILGTGENAALVGELVVIWDKSENLMAIRDLAAFLRNAFLFTAGVVAAALIVSIHLIIGRPLSKMVTALKEVSGGALDVELPRSNTTEVRQMVDTVEVFLGITRDRAALLDDLSDVMKKAQQGDFTGRIHVDGQLTDEKNNLRILVNRLIETVDTGLSEAVRALGSLSERDLTARMNGKFSGAFEKLRVDVDRTASELNSTILTIQGRAQSVQNAAMQLNASSENASSRSQSNAATLEETTASITMVSDALSSTAKIATSAKTVSADVNTHAQNGKSIVDGLVSCMDSINANSASISEIVGLIDDVAFQTNLLALNAGVEAARAGEHGKGFAVVASEVRALAQRTQESASNTNSLVSTSAAEIARGVEQATQAGKSIEEIVLSIQQLDGEISDISIKASDQTAAVDEVRAAITALDRSTQESAEMISQTSSLASELRDSSRSMMEMVAVFNVDEMTIEGQQAA